MGSLRREAPGMGELTVRRNRGPAAVRFQTAGRAEKAAGGGPERGVAGTAGDAVSKTLEQLLTSTAREAGQIRESRRTLQTGEGVLAEVQDRLGRMAELARESGAGASERAGLQRELERLRGEIDRMIGGAMTGGVRMFLDDGGAGEEALLYGLLGQETAGGEAAPPLPDWLASAVGMEGVDPDALLRALGLDGTAGGAALMAAVADGSLEPGTAQAYLAALYLGAMIAGGASSREIDSSRALEGLRQLLARTAEGVPADQAVEELTGGVFTSLWDFQNQFTEGTAPGMQDFLTNLLLSGDAEALLPALSLAGLAEGLEGTGLELLMDLLAALPGSASGPFAAGGEGTERGGSPVSAAWLGEAQVTGRGLSQVRFSEATGTLTVGGGEDITVWGTGRTIPSLTASGSGRVTLRSAHVSVLTVETSQARVWSVGETLLDEVRLPRGAVLELGGAGLIKIGGLRADASNTLRLTGGAVALAEGREDPAQFPPVSVVLEGPVSLAAPASGAVTAGGGRLKAFDVIWKTFLPGWSAITSVETGGRQVRMALMNGDPVRLWLDKGDASRGYPVHGLVIRGEDAFGRPKTRYAYLHWNQRAGTFEEISMYPNPFSVSGGEPGQDWIYDEPSHTLRILTNRVAAVSGGTGTDANQAPFSGRIVLADGIGRMELTLGGVVCRVACGRAFDLGRENDVTLLLRSGSSNCFESGPEYAGISLGEGASLCVDCPDAQGRNPAGSLTAAGNGGGAGIGRDSGKGRDQTSRIVIRGGVVTASGSGGGAGIGAGKQSCIGALSILGGTVSAAGDAGGAGIGGALGAPAGDIVIRGGRITAVAADHAAAIGAGVQGSCGDILITGAARILKALGGDPGADIGACLFGGCGRVQVSGGADIGTAKLRRPAGLALRMGGETVTLPQFRLSSKSLRLEGLSVSTREEARAAAAVIDTDRRWVSRIQEVYGALYSRLERSSDSLYNVHRRIGAAGLVRDREEAGVLLESLLRPSSQVAAGAYGKREAENVGRLLAK